MLLDVRSIASHYGRVQALDNVSISIAEGELVALVGANGAGKTTLMRVLSGVQPLSKGSVRFDGQDLSRVDSDARVRMGISQVPEGRQVFAQMSIADNLLLGAYTRSRAERDDGMERAFEMFPKLKERRNQLAGTLSGGEQQMLAIARALMAKPRLLLLDEPSMGLSPLLVDQTFDIIRKLANADSTIFLVEQNAYMALSIADRGYVMDGGATTLEGTGNDLLDDKRVKQAYLGV
jgi:branched-chain amino acid transport system ATP-binding protein